MPIGMPYVKLQVPIHLELHMHAGVEREKKQKSINSTHKCIYIWRVSTCHVARDVSTWHRERYCICHGIERDIASVMA